MRGGGTPFHKHNNLTYRLLSMFCFSATSLSDAWFVFLLASVILASNPSMLSSLISRSCTRFSLSHFSLFFSLSFIFLKIQMNYDFWCFTRNKSTKCFYMYLAIAAFSCAYDEISIKITIFQFLPYSFQSINNLKW